MITIHQVSTDQDMQHCFTIRFNVFVKGQAVPIEEELDGHDPSSDHYLLLSYGVPAGTARVRFVDGVAKIERVAILENYQGQGLGREIMQFILSDLRQRSAVQTVKLGSQVHAIPFYEKLGFVVCSEVYQDAGIAHKDMKLDLF